MKLLESFLILIFIIPLTFLNCTTTQVSILVTSKPSGVPIEVNGLTIGKTPVRAVLECEEGKKRVHEVKAFPKYGKGDFSQTKKIDPCFFVRAKKGTINFELSSKETESVMPYEIKKEISIKKEDDLETKIQALKKMKNEGIITEAEYKEKALKLIEIK